MGIVVTAQALLFDMDGTLIDSTAAVERTWRRFAARHGLDAAAILASAHGQRTADTVAAHAPRGTDLDTETAWLVAQDVADTRGTVALPGAAELLAALPPDRWALVTSAGRELAERRMAAAGLPLPEVVVTADDVRHGKPHPEGYHTAARRLGVDPRATIVFEDAELGLLAGRAAGGYTVVVGHHGGEAAEGRPRITDYLGANCSDTGDGLRLTLPARAGATV
ncbi:HAD-IA family hydrolase [Streptomyces sp. AC555_RSS877]|uniref:HAD-IA family hydrolase n=1 Tax=Streptomyces sp. AC555_RSS877 TaxID=2823688 RepID=UPI001C254273|nr:HAD-IA family hydrolase [Streptomyces sp. AC555_RSS877]